MRFYLHKDADNPGKSEAGRGRRPPPPKKRSPKITFLSILNFEVVILGSEFFGNFGRPDLGRPITFLSILNIEVVIFTDVGVFHQNIMLNVVGTP